MTRSFTIPMPRARDGDDAPRIYSRNGMLTCVNPPMRAALASVAKRMTQDAAPRRRTARDQENGEPSRNPARELVQLLTARLEDDDLQEVLELLGELVGFERVPSEPEPDMRRPAMDAAAAHRANARAAERADERLRRRFADYDRLHQTPF